MYQACYGPGSQVIPVAFSSWRIFDLWSFMLGNQQGQSVSHRSFIDSEFRMIKATQVYSYMVPYISSFLASIRMLIGFHNYINTSRHSTKSCLSDHSITFTKKLIEPTVTNVWRQIATVLKERKGQERAEQLSFDL